ncbi:MAG: hypothetical protein KGH69_02215 [Candidatus Micrarchaeota archaeon]|nr:hypothetical protein [Candidatus Micrarchaeota archaeon]
MLLLALLVLISSVLLGTSVASRLGFAKGALFRIAVGIPIGIALFSSALVALYFVFGSISAYIVLALVVASSIVSYALSGRNLRLLLHPGNGDEPTGLLPIIAAVFLVLFVFWFTSMYQGDGALFCRSNAACSDLLYHVGIGNSLLYHGPMPPYPYSIGTVNVFPFVFDLYSSLLMKLGLGMVYATMVPDILLLFSLAYLTATIIHKVTRSIAGTAAAMLMFWFGTNYSVALVSYLLAPHIGILNQLPQLSSVLVLNGMSASTKIGALLALSGGFVTQWIPILNPILMPQRDFLLGLPLGLIALYLLLCLLFEKRRLSVGELLLLGSIVGLMPLIHPPTEIVIVFAILFSVAYLAVNGRLREELGSAWIAAAPAIGIGSVEVYYMCMQQLPPGWYHFVYLSRIFAGQNLLLTVANTIAANVAFLVEAFGIVFLLAMVWLFISKDRIVRLLSIPIFALLFISLVFSFQPVWTDNGRITLYAFLFMAAFAGALVGRLWENRGTLPRIAACLLVVLISGNSIVIYINSTIMYNGYWLLTQQELAASDFITNNTPVGSVFLVSNYGYLQNQPVSTVAARQTVLSESPYVDLEVHSLSIPKLLEIQGAALHGSCVTMRQYNISYIYIDSASPRDTAPFNNGNFAEVFSAFDTYFNRNITIFKSLCG